MRIKLALWFVLEVSIASTSVPLLWTCKLQPTLYHYGPDLPWARHQAYYTASSLAQRNVSATNCTTRVRRAFRAYRGGLPLRMFANASTARITLYARHTRLLPTSMRLQSPVDRLPSLGIRCRLPPSPRARAAGAYQHWRACLPASRPLSLTHGCLYLVVAAAYYHMDAGGVT